MPRKSVDLQHFDMPVHFGRVRLQSTLFALPIRWHHAVSFVWWDPPLKSHQFYRINGGPPYQGKMSTCSSMCDLSVQG